MLHLAILGAQISNLVIILGIHVSSSSNIGRESVMPSCISHKISRNPLLQVPIPPFYLFWCHEHVPCMCHFVLLLFCPCLHWTPCQVLYPPYYNSKIYHNSKLGISDSGVVSLTIPSMKILHLFMWHNPMVLSVELSWTLGGRWHLFKSDTFWCPWCPCWRIDDYPFLDLFNMHRFSWAPQYGKGWVLGVHAQLLCIHVVPMIV